MSPLSLWEALVEPQLTICTGFCVIGEKAIKAAGPAQEDSARLRQRAKPPGTIVLPRARHGLLLVQGRIRTIPPRFPNLRSSEILHLIPSPPPAAWLRTFNCGLARP